MVPLDVSCPAMSQQLTSSDMLFQTWFLKYCSPHAQSQNDVHLYLCAVLGFSEDSDCYVIRLMLICTHCACCNHGDDLHD